MKHIIFDLDGTLIDSKSEVLKTYLLVLNEIAPPYPVNTYRLDYSVNINDQLKSIYLEDIESIINAKRLFVSLYDNSDFEETHLYPGVKETLHKLKVTGYEIFVATNKRHAPTLRILEKKMIKDLFTNVIGYERDNGIKMNKREMIAALKKEGNFSKGYMVGDSSGDIQAGNEEGLITVAVKYGYENEQMLMDKKPAFLIDKFADLLSCLG